MTVTTSMTPATTSNRTPKVAVLLNGNAKRVKPALVDRLAKVLSRDHIYYSHTLEEGEKHCQTIYSKGYDLVFTGGGDGTFLQCVTQLGLCQDADTTPKALPVMGVLHLGTGNAVASTLGAQPDILKDIKRALQPQRLPVKSHKWVSVQGQQTPFAGVGYDSLVLNEYNDLKESTANTPYSWIGRGSMGYFLAVLRAVPKAIFRKRIEVEVRNEGDTSAFLLGAEGQHVKEFAPGEIMFTGKATTIGASTLPCFGFGFQMFPFAKSGDKMNLRVATTSVFEVLRNLVSIWRGTYRSQNLFDFHADKVSVSFPQAEPVQIGGDAAGHHEGVTFTLSEGVTQLADFSAPARPALRPARPAQNLS